MSRQLTYLEKRYGKTFAAKPLWYEVNVYQDYNQSLNRCFKRGNHAHNYADKLVWSDVYCAIYAVLANGDKVEVCCC